MVLAGIMILSISCSKKEKEAIDCVAELTLATLSYTPNENNPKEITITLEYGGEFTATIVWEFDDGTSKTTVGKTVTHVYTDPGNYEVKANITLSAEDKLSCSVSKKKYIDVL